MGKVVTSQGLTEFVQTGKVTHVPDHKPTTPKTSDSGSNSESSAVESGNDKTPVIKGNGSGSAQETQRDAGQSKSNSEAVSPEVEADEAEDDTGLRASDAEFSEKTRKRIQAKHRALKEARAEAQENERFAEQQFNERKLAEKRAQEAEERAKALEAQLPKKEAEPELKVPSIADFKDAQGNVDWDKYTDAKADFAAKKAVMEERARLAEEAATRERTEAEGRMKARFDAVRKAHPDFDELVEKIKGTEADNVPQHVLNYLFESEKGGELHYYLLKNPVESVRISKLKPILALAELGKLEAKLTEPPAKTTPTASAEPVNRKEPGGAPAPITPLSGEGNTGIVTDPAKMDFKQLRAYERERARSKRER